MAWAYVLGVFTSSFDIFGVINLGPTLRISQMFLAVPIAFGLRLACVKAIRLPLGFGSLAIWTGVIIAFVPNTTFLPRNIGYAVWLVYSVALVFATVQLFTNEVQVVWLVRWYLYSFLFVAAFGVVQFVMPLLRLSPPLVTQWWFPGVLARVNGFSYEPSYFATYILIGWVLSAALLQLGSEVLPQAKLRTIFATCTVALVVSSSRTGWIMMALWCSQYPLRLVSRVLMGRLPKRLIGISIALGSVLLAIVTLAIRLGPENISFLLAGTGLQGAASHSVSSRGGAFHDTIHLFLNSPIVGCSLGGVAAGIGKLNGVVVSSFDQAKMFEGNSVFAEVLAASGIVGFLAFAVYVAALIVRPLRLARLLGRSDAGSLLAALTLALVFELIMLQFNQNILRLYVWIHVATLSAVYSVARSRMSATSAPYA